MKRKIDPELAAAERALSLRDQIINATYNNERPDETIKFGHSHYPDLIDPGESYTYELWRSTGAIGGILVVVFKCKGQRPMVDIYAFDERQNPPVNAPMPLRVAMERLTATRYRLIHNHGYAVA